jgi:hypothetical protein
MKIPISEKNMLETLGKYNSNDYYLYNENDEYEAYDELGSSEDMKYLMDEFDSIVNSYWLITGSAGTWMGRREIRDGYAYKFKSFIKRMRGIDELEFGYDNKEKAIIIRGFHHDGVNMYEIRKPEWFTKTEIIDIMRAIETRKEINKWAKERFDKPLSKLTKNELIEILKDYLEDYN